MGSDVDCQMSSACRTLILCVAADRGLDRGDFPEPAEGADAWSEPAQGQPTVLQTGDYNVLICGNSNRNPGLGTYRAGSLVTAVVRSFWHRCGTAE
jgi:hypothetical protein